MKKLDKFCGKCGLAVNEEVSVKESSGKKEINKIDTEKAEASAPEIVTAFSSSKLPISSRQEGQEVPVSSKEDESTSSAKNTKELESPKAKYLDKNGNPREPYKWELKAEGRSNEEIKSALKDQKRNSREKRRVFTKDNFSYKKIFTVIGGGAAWLASGVIFQTEKGLFIGIFVLFFGFLYLLGRFFIDLGTKGKVLMGPSVVIVVGTLTVSILNMINSANTERLAVKGLTWEKHFYHKSVGSVQDLEMTPNSGILFVGTADRDDAIGMIYGLISTSGEVIWQRPLNGVGSGSLSSIEVVPDGGALLGGRSYNRESTKSGLLARVDTKGDLLWSRQYGVGEVTRINQIISLDDGRILLAGSDSDEIRGGENAYIALLESNGEVIWENRYEANGEVKINSIAVTDNEEIIAVGSYKINSELSKARFLKVGMDGETISRFSYGSTKEDGNSYYSASVVEIEPDGKIIVGGTGRNDGERTLRMAMYEVYPNFDGADVRKYSGPIIGSANINAFHRKDNGNLIMAGHTTQRDNDGESSATVFEINSDGELVDSWHMPTHHDTYINDMIVLPSGAQIIAGQSPRDRYYRPSMFIAEREPNTGRATAEMLE